ncbi:MAG: hypothetical protein R3F49_14665 [Planctomycetota bacterium]
MESNDDLKREMARFEAARVTAPIDLQPAELRVLLAVFDGTDQDATVAALARAISARTGATVREHHATGAEPLMGILAAAEGADLVIAPSPFGRDYLTEGHESLSTTIDLLLTRCEAPVCLARAPVDDAERCVSHPLVALQVDRHRKVDATAVGLALARGGGGLALLSVVDPSERTKREELIGRYIDPRDLSPEVLATLASARAAALTAALQRHAREWNVDARVKFGLGEVVERTLDVAARRRGLIVAGRDRDATSEGAQRARRLVLASALPVLLV